MHVLTPTIGIEISRRCNLTCSHCMRGEAENCVIDSELLSKFFDEVKSANMLVISGGEPFLCYEEINMLIEVLKNKNVLIPKVLVVTNGTIYDDRIYKLLEPNFEEIEIYISIDNYHFDSILSIYDNLEKSENPGLNPVNYEEVAENIKMHQNNPHFVDIYGEKKYLINSGRATTLDKPKRDFEALGYFYMNYNQKCIVAGPQIYLDALGNITDGNSSYDSRSEISIGNIHENSVSELLVSNAIKVDNLSLDQFIDFMDQREDDYQQYRGKKYVYKNNKISEN